eukprot:scaffold25641_cov72-Phaeocystis_antarctica.AAC.2
MAPCTESSLLAYRIHTVYALRAPLTHTACTLRAVRVSPTGTRSAHRPPAVVLLSGCAAPLVAGVACGALLYGVVRDLLLRRWLKTAKSARVWLSLTFQPSTSTRPPGLGPAVWGLCRCGWGSMRVVGSFGRLAVRSAAWRELRPTLVPSTGWRTLVGGWRVLWNAVCSVACAALFARARSRLSFHAFRARRAPTPALPAHTPPNAASDP